MKTKFTIKHIDYQFDKNVSKRISNSFLVILFIIVGLYDVSAQEINPLQSANGFNLFTQNDAKLGANGSEMEGPAAIGGDLTITGSYNVYMNNLNGFPIPYSINGDPIALAVNGKVNFDFSQSWEYFRILNDAFAKINNSIGLKEVTQDINHAQINLRLVKTDDALDAQGIEFAKKKTDFNSDVFASTEIDFNSAFLDLQNSSTILATKTDDFVGLKANGNNIANASNLPSNTNLEIQLYSGANYLNIPSSELNKINEIKLTGVTLGNGSNNTGFLIINVIGNGSFEWKPGNLLPGGDANAPYVLYNFRDITELKLGQWGQEVIGSILAPNADIKKTAEHIQNIVGQIIGKSFDGQLGSGEVHYRPFLGQVNLDNPEPDYPNIDLVKTGTYIDTNNNGQIDAGDQIEYVFTITNIGNVPLTNILVFDAKLPNLPSSPIALDPEESDNTGFTALYTLTSADLNAGYVSNTATVNAKDPNNQEVSDTDSTTLTFGIDEGLNCNEFDAFAGSGFSVNNSKSGLLVQTDDWINKGRLIDGNPSNYASSGSLLSLGSKKWIEAKNENGFVSAGSYAGFM